MALLRTGLFWCVGLALVAGGAIPAAAEVTVVPPAPKAPAEETAPAVFRVNFTTSRGLVVIEFLRSQAPHGVDRLFSLVQAKYFDGARFYRVVPGFVVQWGSAADPHISQSWDRAIPDDPVKTTNARGTITFAALGEPNSRTTQMFINLGDNPGLDAMGFAPLGRVLSGMQAIDQIYAGDGENPDQGAIMEQGNAYLQKAFPHLDYIVTARLVP